MTSHRTLSTAATTAFMGLVTCCMLALLFAEAARGLEGAAGMVVYGVTVAFGLDYLGSAWVARWRPQRR
jgi:hypothetical protein